MTMLKKLVFKEIIEQTHEVIIETNEESVEDVVDETHNMVEWCETIGEVEDALKKFCTVRSVNELVDSKHTELRFHDIFNHSEGGE
jgi:hypothetical protein